MDLSQHVVRNKQDLFVAWLEAGRNWDKARMIITRTHKSENESMAGWVAKPGKEIVKEYGEAKAKELMAKRYAAGLYYNHEDFEHDEMERFYYMRKPKEVTKRHVVADESKIEAEANLNDHMLRALVDENEGVMRAGALPTVHTANKDGQKALMDGLHEGGVAAAAPKKKAKKEAEGSQEVKPKSMLEKAVDLMSEILTDTTKARKKSMSLGAVNYAGELAKELLEYAQRMEGYYKTLQTATTNNVDNEGFYEKWFKKITAEREWFTQAEASWCSKPPILHEECTAHRYT